MSTTSTKRSPERAGREGDQPLPVEGRRDVLADLAMSVPRELAARREIGVRRYGRPLETWNGRDVHRDLDDELLDALAYARQAREERRDLEGSLAQAKVELAAARADLASQVQALDRRIATLKEELAAARSNWTRAMQDLGAEQAARAQLEQQVRAGGE